MEIARACGMAGRAATERAPSARALVEICVAVLSTSRHRQPNQPITDVSGQRGAGDGLVTAAKRFYGYT